MLGRKSTPFSVVGTILIFLCSAYGLKNPDRQLILEPGSNLVRMMSNNSVSILNHYQIRKPPLALKRISTAFSSHFNMAAHQKISNANIDLNKKEFEIQGQIHDQVPRVKWYGSNLNRMFLSKTQTMKKKTKKNQFLKQILNEEMPDKQKILGIMDILWSALNYGSLTELNKKIPGDPLSLAANYWAILKENINIGALFVEIGGCLTASSVATHWGSNSVAVSLVFKGLYNECILNTRESRLRNFFIGTVSHVQEMVESLSSDPAVAIEYLLLSDLQVLWHSLLPHECENLVSKILAVSWRVYVVNPTARIGHVTPYTSWWSNLGTFLEICCQKKQLHCTIDILNGTNSWQSPSVFQVTLKSRYKPVVDISSHIDNTKNKLQSSQMNHSSAFFMQGKGGRFDSQGNNIYSFPVLSKGVSWSKESLELLILLSLKMPSPVWNKIAHLPVFTLKPFHLEGIDESLYQSHWEAVKFLFEERFNGKFSLLVYGTKHLTLLAAKTGLVYPHSTILNIIPMLDAAFANIYRDILSPNVLTSINDLNEELLNTISHLPNLFTFQILGMDIFAKMFWSNENFVKYLGKILSLAHITIFTVPNPERFNFVQIFLVNINGSYEENKDFTFERLIVKAAVMIGAEIDIKVIKQGAFGGSLLFVEWKHPQKEVLIDCSHGKGILIFEPVSTSMAYIQTTKSLMSFDTKTIVLSLLLALKLVAVDRQNLFLHYLQLPICEDMCPHLIFWSVQGLTHFQHSQTEQKGEHFPSNANLKLLERIFTKELKETSAPFSFLEYQSKGSLISQLAVVFPNSTFIAVAQNHQTATSVYQETKANNLENLLITQHAVDDIFTRKLLRSPEFFHYQFISYECFLNLVRTLSRDKFNLMIGQLLSISVSNFFILPSEKIISLAVFTFYPEFHLHQMNRVNHNSEKNDYLSGNHPSRFYKKAERKIIFESARADVEAEVEAVTSQYFQLGEGTLFPWRLLRVNLKNLTTEVEHHFESYLDGHTRTYVQRCTSLRSGHYEVYLERQSDGLIIPYGNVHVITLIALFRMGLLAEFRTKLYHQFLKLPLYEDMAPWNIVFSAGQLEYIDFDTKNKTLDSVVPMAYQIMSVLMNYERTIKDFGKCKGRAKTQFGFDFISSCVESDFLGPCKDATRPVPCGDYTCRSTYVECLQALAKTEETKK